MFNGLQAGTADPLWLLARQAAFGEFQGDDAGAPVSVRIQARVSALTRLRAGQSGATVRLAPNATPLEVAVESTPGAGGVGALDSAQAGRHYLRLLEGAPGIGDLTTYRNGLLSVFPFPPLTSAGSVPAPGHPPAADPRDPRLRAYVGRVPDGATLYASLRTTLSGGTLPAQPGLDNAAPTVVLAVAQQWYAWYEALFVQGVGASPAWNPARLEHVASAASPGPDVERVLTCTEYASGNLDWLDFDLLATGVSLGAVASDLPAGETKVSFAALPTSVRYPGMPLPRFWAFEDAAVDFGAVTAAIENLTTSAMIEFALRYGNDHWIIPFPLDVGSVCVIDSLVVADTFGEVLLILPAATIDGSAGPFRLFEHTVAGPSIAPARDPVFVLFPTLDHVLVGGSLEEVHYLRDEIADMVWAVERTAIGLNGLPVDRTQAELVRRQAGSAVALSPSPNHGTGPQTRRYLLRTDVPGNWFPVLPPDSALGAVTALTLAVIPPLDGSAPSVPWGQLLVEQTSGIAPEEVTRAGAQASRAWRCARWTDGRQLTWIGRRAGTGRGPGASGLRFDLAL